jgi:uncharacterized protein with FMN-binding domain
MTAFAAGALLFPIAQDAAALAPAKAKVVPIKRVVTRKFTGPEVNADRWGTVQVNITVRKTTTITGRRRRITRRYLDLGGRYSYHTGRSQFIMSQSLPILRQEFLQAQSATIDMVSGATYTSEAFMQSLQAALVQARRG